MNAEPANELAAMKYAPLGMEIDDYIICENEDEVNYLTIRRGAVIYLDKHQYVIQEYKWKREKDPEEAQRFLIGIVNFVQNHIIYIMLKIKESQEEATTKSANFKDMTRENIVPNIINNFTIDEDEQNELMNAVFNLTNFSGIAIGYGRDEENPTGSMLHIFIFNF